MQSGSGRLPPTLQGAWKFMTRIGFRDADVVWEGGAGVHATGSARSGSEGCGCEGRGLEVDDEIASGAELVAAGAEVVGGEVEGVIEAELGAELDGGAEPVIEGDRVLVIAALVAGALAFLVIEEGVA